MARRRGANPLSLERAKRSPKRERDEPPASFSPLLGLLTHPATASPTATHCGGRVAAGAGVERGLPTRFSNRHLVSVRRQPRGSFGINAPDCKQVLPTTSRLRLLGWPTTLRLLTNLICNRPLSSSDSSMKPLFCVRRVEALRPQPLRSATATPAFCDRRPFLCRRSTFLCRRANFFCRRVSPGEAAPKGATRRGDPTASVRSTLRLAPTADPIRPFRRRKPARPAAPL